VEDGGGTNVAIMEDVTMRQDKAPVIQICSNLLYRVGETWFPVFPVSRSSMYGTAMPEGPGFQSSRSGDHLRTVQFNLDEIAAFFRCM
jgi:hypothetical protein